VYRKSTIYEKKGRKSGKASTQGFYQYMLGEIEKKTEESQRRDFYHMVSDEGKSV